MQLAFNLQGAGFTADIIDTTSEVVLENGTITTINLTTSVKAEGLDQAKFEELVNHAKENCPISKLFNATITLQATLL